jgi:hypothetical protein
VNPLRLLAISRRVPYRCKRCKGYSRLPARQNTIATVLTTAAILACALLVPRFGLWKVAALSLPGLALLVGGTVWLFMRLEPIGRVRRSR